MRTLHDENFEGKNVLVRVDFNVTLEQGDIAERYKVESAKKTIEHLLRCGARTITLMSHLGRPEGKYDAAFSLRNIIDDIERVLGFSAIFVPEISETVVKNAIDGATPGSIFLLENTRFFVGEEQNDEAFSRMLAAPFDVFVNDAFSVCHRDQASVTGVSKFLPSVAGLRLEEEVAHLTRVRDTPDRAAVAVIGGAKIETKLPLIHTFERLYDRVLVGGKIANEAMDARMSFLEKVLLPVDFEGGADRLDIGPKTIRAFSDVLAEAKTIVWNGPLGKFEDARYARGTEEIIRAITTSNAFTVTGGGESVEVLEHLGCMQNFSFVSTGGGAMLEFLSGEPMPGIDVLSK